MLRHFVWPRCLLLLLVTLASGCPQQVPVSEITPASPEVINELPAPVYTEADWPSWRGPQQNGQALPQEVPTTWRSTENVLWSVNVPGRGHSSPVVCGGKVFLATALESEQKQLVLAYQQSDGNPLWQTVVHTGNFPGSGELHKKGTNANGTVACDGERIFVGFLNSGAITVSALDLDGKILWQQEVGKFNSKFGYAPSPLIYKSFVIIAADNQGGGYLAALDRATGAVRWRKARAALSSYSSPMIASVSGKDQLLISGCHEVASFDPATGEQLWTLPGTAEATCGTVVTSEDLVFASGGYPESETICVRGDGSRKVWNVREKIYEPSMVVFQGNLLGIADNGIGYLWEAAGGKQLWRERLNDQFSASPVVCGDNVFVPSLSGHTLVLTKEGEGMKVVARNKLGTDTYASPAICGGRIYLRVGEGDGEGRVEKLYCIGQK
jgi:outer membrane protein assembly factor BamB